MTMNEQSGRFRFNPLSRAEAKEVLSWRYDPPYDLYNGPDLPTDADIHGLLRPELNYFAVHGESGQLIAFRCFGEDARVVGGDYSSDALDMGGGIRPDLCGYGIGGLVIAVAMNFAIDRFSPHRFRTTVAAFNQRALKVCKRLGYKRVSSFTRTCDGRDFVILEKPAERIDL